MFTAAELAVNNEAVKKTVAASRAAIVSGAFDVTIASLRLEESTIRSRVAFANSQLRYELDHRDYLLDDLKRVLELQHSRK